MARRGAGLQGDMLPSDSLLDVITNLVGVMIVVVMLVLIGTRRQQPEIPRPQRETGAARAYLEEAASLRGEMDTMQAEIDDIAAKSKVLDEDIRRLRRQNLGPVDDIASLKQQLKQTLAAGSKAADDLRELRQVRLKIITSEPPRRTVYFRRPVLRKSAWKRPLRFTIMKSRIAWLDVEGIWDWAEGLSARERAKPRKCDVDPTVTVHVPLDGLKGKIMNLLLTVDPNRGEKLDPETQAADLVVRTALRKGGTDQVFLTFSVWPDSFDYYRKLRAVLLARGYEVGWSPRSDYTLGYTRLIGSGMERPQ